MFQGVSVIALVIVAFIVVTVLMGIRQVPQGFNYTVERFGKYNKTLTPDWSAPLGVDGLGSRN